MAIVISGNGIDMGNNPVSNASQIEVQQEQVSPFNGFKNYIINGKKVVNQRGLTSTDNSYNQDRWYKAGNNWYQGIEGDNNLISGKTYTLSWEGTATASYYVGTATSATINSQTFTPISNGESFTLTIAAGQNLWIKFTSDAAGNTFNFVQLEEGSVATPFEHRPIGLELSLCQRYYEKSYSLNTPPATVTFLDAIVGDASQTSDINCEFKIEKRVIPTMIYYSAKTGIAGKVHYRNTIAVEAPSGDINVTAQYVGTKRIAIETQPGDAYMPLIHFTASAEL